MKKAAWNNYAIAALGVFLCVSPTLLDYVAQRQAAANAFVVGAVLAATTVRRVFAPRGWEEGLASGTGAWLAISPWVLGFSTSLNPTVTALATGLLAVALSQSDILDRALASIRSRLNRSWTAHSGVLQSPIKRLRAARAKRAARAPRRLS